MTGRPRARRGSALILVLVMTLAVAGLAVAAIFMSSSAGLLSRFYDRERDYRLAAESGLELARARLAADLALVVPDTGMVQLAAGLRVPAADGTIDTRISINIYAAATGDTSATGVPSVTLIASAYDIGGTRHVRRMDLRRESFSRYQLFVDSFPSGMTFGPGTVAGRVHTNATWRSGTTAATAGVYRDTITAVDGFSGTATYVVDSMSGVLPVRYPRDSVFAWMTTLATSANLSFDFVPSSAGRRLEFVAFDADGDGTVEAHEGFARVFDLAAGVDTSRLRVSLDPLVVYGSARRWDDPVVQSQCGAFYFRNDRWMFFPIATHRASWTHPIINQGGPPAIVPVPAPPTMTAMATHTWNAVSLILGQSTARCFPAGSPYLVTTERFTNEFGVVTGTAADTLPFGVVTPSGGWPASAPNGYGGTDTTFTPRSMTCSFSTGGTSGRCDPGTVATLGSWRAFGGAPVSGIPTTIRQANELPYLWPLTPPANPNARGVLRATGGHLFVSGKLRGQQTLVVDGSVHIIESLTYHSDPDDPTAAPCDDQLGIVAVGDVLVADNAMVRARRIWLNLFSSTVRHLGSSRDIAIHGNLMSLTGTVGVENPDQAAPLASGLECPQTGGSANSAGGCYLLTGGAVMARYTPLWSGSNTGFRWAGTPDRCQHANRRPPHFPLTNRYSVTRTIEIEAMRANTPAKVRALLMSLKGKTL